MPEFYSDAHIRNRIHLIRDHLVILQPDLARLYGVTENRLLAHAGRFPGHFCFQLEPTELQILNGRRVGAWEEFFAFTEHGTMVMAYRLAAPRAVAMSAQILRAFMARRRSEAVRLGLPLPLDEIFAACDGDPSPSARSARPAGNRRT